MSLQKILHSEFHIYQSFSQTIPHILTLGVIYAKKAKKRF